MLPRKRETANKKNGELRGITVQFNAEGRNGESNKARTT
jgi:hypothetical protein